MNFKAVIGAGFGDEGKGLMTDYLASKSRNATLVIRFNGGAQAGHTVRTPDELHHVFHHFGSGTFAGADTYLSEYFIVNPWLCVQEFNVLQAMGYLGFGDAMVDIKARITTPYDMIINQEIERIRGDDRFGSCGLGIHETITRISRSQSADIIRLNDTLDADLLRTKLAKIQEDWAPRRLMELVQILGVKTDRISHAAWSRIESPEILDSFVEACQRVSEILTFIDKPPDVYENIIFEGAQGLLLDELHPYAPYVTRSRTGLTNVGPLMRRFFPDKNDIDVTYVTRSYMTRHGAGPFATERSHMDFPDSTNQPNEWQGALRFGTLDVDLIAETVRSDLRSPGLNVNPHLAMTCLDQYTPDPDTFKYILTALDMPLKYISRGPTRDHVQDLLTVPVLV